MVDQRPQSGFRKVLAVAFREFRHTVFTKGFIFGALVVPVIMFGAIAAIGALVGSQIAPVEGTVAILDASGTVGEQASQELAPAVINKQQAKEIEGQTKAVTGGAMPGGGMPGGAAAFVPRVNLTVESFTDPAKEEALRARVQGDDLLALAIIPPEVLRADPRDAKGDPATFTLIVPSKSPPRLTALIERAVAASIVRARVKSAGNDYSSLNSLLSVPDTSVRRLASDGQEAKESLAAKTLLPMGFMMLLWITTFTSGQYLLTSTIEEKSSKVMEVVLSAVSPMQLLGGKILGFALVSAVMLAMYGALGISGLIAAAMSDLVTVRMLLLMIVYFVLAYSYVAIMMASVGSAVSDLREAQSLVGPVMIILIIPLMLWLPISEQPNGWLATIMSFVPPAIPFVMILRVTASSEPIPVIQIIGSIAWGFTCAAIFFWAGTKIFRVGVLMQGKPPTPRELLKWIRMA